MRIGKGNECKRGVGERVGGGGGVRNAEPVKVVWQQVCLRIHFDVVYLMSLSKIAV